MNCSVGPNEYVTKGHVRVFGWDLLGISLHMQEGRTQCLQVANLSSLFSD